MMSVGDVERVDGLERLDERRHEPRLDLPDRMAHAIERREIDERLVGRPYAPRKLVDLRIRTMRQKDGSGLRPQLDHVARAVVFLVLPRPLVFLDDVAVVLGERIARGHARLAVPVSVEMIEIHRGLGFLNERRIPFQRAIPVGCRAIHDIGVRIGAGGQIDLGPRDVEKTQRIAAGKRARFLRVDDIVGNGGDPVRDSRIGANSTEGSDDSHLEPSII